MATILNLSHIWRLISLFAFAASMRTNDKIYYDIASEDFSMCFRRFNSTNQIGCSSSRSGNVGVLHVVESTADVDWVMDIGPHHPYIIVMPVGMFNRTIITKLIDSKKVNGIVILPFNESDVPVEFSPDSACPNDRFGLYHDDANYTNCNKTQWNYVEDTNDLMFHNFPFPIVILSNATNAEFIRKCYMEHNAPLANGSAAEAREYPLCAMKLSSVMDGAKDTPTCDRRTKQQVNLSPQGYCDPIGGVNVMAYMDALNASETLDNDSVTVVAARLDAFSMFDGRYPGVDSAAIGFVALHAVAEALGHAREDLGRDALARPVLFALFNGEAFDYIGSSRVVYDMMNTSDLAPLTLDSIGAFIELGQLGLHDTLNDTLYVHSDPLHGASSTRLDALKQALMNASSGADVKLESAPPYMPLPPASLQSFLRHRPNIAGVLLATHWGEFKNKYYNSIHDRPSASGMDYPSDWLPFDPAMYDHVTRLAGYVGRVATMVARVVYALATNRTADANVVKASNLTITRLLYCFTLNSSCELLNQTAQEGMAEAIRDTKTYLSRYVGVSQSTRPLAPMLHHQSLLARHIGMTLPDNTTSQACSDLNKAAAHTGYRYLYLHGEVNQTDNSTRDSVCVRAAVNITPALSPAFVIHDYRWSDELYSAWTESRWETDAMQVRVFLLPSPSQEIWTLCGGLAVLLLSFALVFVVENKSGILFACEGV